MEPKMGKRMVSRGKYVKAQADRTFFGMIGIGSWLGAFFMALLMIGCFVGMCICMVEASFGAAGGFLIAVLILAVFSRGCGRMGIEAMQMVNAIDPGVPLTRTSAAQLPQSESLVRASSEPLQAQEAVLLRAAVEGVERHEEQLVRAVNAKE